MHLSLEQAQSCQSVHPGVQQVLGVGRREQLRGEAYRRLGSVGKSMRWCHPSLKKCFTEVEVVAAWWELHEQVNGDAILSGAKLQDGVTGDLCAVNQEDDSGGEDAIKPIDPLLQLITLFSQSALMERRCVFAAEDLTGHKCHVFTGKPCHWGKLVSMTLAFLDPGCKIF